MIRYLLALLLFLPVVASAQAVARYEKFTNTSGVQLLIPVGSSSGNSTGQLLWNQALNQTDGGMPRVGGAGQLINPSGVAVEVAGAARMPAAEVAKAVGRAAAKVIGPLAAGAALYDLYKELNFEKHPDGSVTKADPTVCSVAPCFQYGYTSIQTGNLIWFATKELGAAYWMATRNAAYGTTFTSFACFVSVCTFYRPGGSENQGFSVNPIAPSVDVGLASSDQEFLDAVAARSGWPSTSAINSVLKDEIGRGPSPLGVGPITVTGPATSSGPVTTTTDTAKNSTTTNTTTHNHQYAGNTVTTTTNNTSVTVDNSTGDVINTTTTTVNNPADTKPDNTVKDSDLPDLPTLYSPKYPDGLVGVWAEKKAQLTSAPLVALVSQLMPTVSSTGTCPVLMVNLDLGLWDYGSHDVAPPCYIWEWCRFFILAGALFLARGLIFGG